MYGRNWINSSRRLRKQDGISDVDLILSSCFPALSCCAARGSVDA